MENLPEINVQKTILAGLVCREEYTRKVLPYLKLKYFDKESDQLLFATIDEFLVKYNSVPPKESLLLELSLKPNIKQNVYDEARGMIGEIFDDDNVTFVKTVDIEWLIKKTEEYCQHKAIYNAIMDSIEIMDGKKKDGKAVVGSGAIPQILSDALAVCFDPNIGHDYFESAEGRFAFYHKELRRIKTRLELINKITKGGWAEKTLNIFAAGTNVGKTIWLCSLAADALLDGYNVLFITLEMSEEMINQRIDSNLLDVKMEELEGLPQDLYMKKVNAVRAKTPGKLITKEYPTGGASVLHFKALINELRMKKQFRPDIVFIDYLNICDSAKIKNADGMYEYMKKIAEELRGFAIENVVPIVTATQLNRDGARSTDYDMTDISESFGVAMTADFMVGLISTDQLEQMGQMRVKQLKNRYWPVTNPKSFLVNVDKTKMRVYNSDNPSADVGGPTTPQSHSSGSSQQSIGNKFSKRPLFSDFKV